MPLTVDTIRNFTGTGSIMLDTKTGGLATSALQKFRSFFNFGDARQKNGETLTAIHHAILNDPNFAAPDIRAEALRLLSEIRTDRAIGAAQVRTIMHTLDSLTQDTATAVSSRVAARLAATMPAWAAGQEKAVLSVVTAHVLNGKAAAGSYSAIDVAGRTQEALDHIGAALAYAGDDPDLKAVLFASLKRTLVDVNGNLVSDQQMRQRVDTFRADVAAIDGYARQSANPAATKKLGMQCLMKLGRPVDPQVLVHPELAFSGDATMVTSVRKAVLEPLHLDSSPFPGAAMHAKIDAGVKSMISGAFASEMKKIATDAGDLTFDKDIVRGMRIFLPDGTRVANDTALARDQFAQLVTGNSQATFATLSPADRAKANAFVALLMQETETSLERGVPTSLSHVRGDMAYMPVAGGDMPPTRRAFHVSGSPSEGFTIHHQATYPAVVLMYDDERGGSQTLMMQDGKRVYCSYEMEIRIPAASLDKIAATDWSQYDNKTSDAILHKPQEHADFLAAHYKSIPEKFRLDCEVAADFSVEIGVHPQE